MGGRLRDVPSPEDRLVAVRAYAIRAEQKQKWQFRRTRPPGPSGFTLIFNTETFSDAAQQLRVGAYQWREDGLLREAGLFHDPSSASADELRVIAEYARALDLELRTDRSFVDEVFYGLAYELNATIVGFNLPFDVSRLAIHHNSARGNMRGGFTFSLSEGERWPNVRVRHLNSRSALIDFRARRGERTPRSQRKKQRRISVRRGYFVDVRTAAAAVIGGSHDLRSLAELLDTPREKLDMEEYSGPITSEFLDYARTDVQVTWECYEQIARRYEGYGLTKTRLPSIYSEASVGKACLRQMGTGSWTKLQPEFPPEILGIIMSTYYGGRSEVRIRRQVVRSLYCDFASMYPSVCTLMGLWDFVIAQGIEYEDATEETRALLDRITLRDLKRKDAWRTLPVLVRVRPRADLFPVRTKYSAATEEGRTDRDAQYTIGLNYLSPDEPLWFTLADCIASKILTGRQPEVLEAVRFLPGTAQKTLQPVDVLGRPEYRIDPSREDFFRRLIELRIDVRSRMKQAQDAGRMEEAKRLDAEQLALKITANASSYGIFVELNVDSRRRLQELVCYGPAGKPFPAFERNVETPGSFFHPLLATLITGAARLMLAVTERLVEHEHIAWAFCDTDSMALACPPEMNLEEFLTRAERVRAWFDPLYPYKPEGGQLFEVKEQNYRLVGGKPTKDIDPPWCLAVSAKRHCLFNIDGKGRPVIRKASGHGLGHLLPPYAEERSPRSIPKPGVPLEDLDLQRWEYDLWYRIVLAALGDPPEHPKTENLPGFGDPAVARYAATTPALLRWFTTYNRGRPYREQVRPFGFLLAYQADPLRTKGDELPRAVSPFDRDLGTALALCFDRETGRPVRPDELRTYRRALAQYHLNPEAKFQGADYLDSGPTRRRHIRASGIEHIGKEANRWEEQFYLGFDPEAQVAYGVAPDDRARHKAEILRACLPYTATEIARASGVARSAVSDFLSGKSDTLEDTLRQIQKVLPVLQAERQEQDESDRDLLARVKQRIREDGLRAFARGIGEDGSNLWSVVHGRRPMSQRLRAKLTAVLDPPSRV
jgi:transcriptional regulator with XRE-family HTH domain